MSGAGSHGICSIRDMVVLRRVSGSADVGVNVGDFAILEYTYIYYNGHETNKDE